MAIRGLGERRQVAERVRALVAASAPAGWVPAPVARPDAAGEEAALQPDARPARVTRAQARAAARPARLSGRLRADPGRRAAALIGLVTVLAGAVTGGWILRGRPQATPVAVATSGWSSPASRPSPAPAPSSPSAVAQLVVDVVGKVSRPGLYRLPAGSRIDDALRAAGGALPGVDLAGLNLARKVSDGEQVAVGVPAAPAPASGSGQNAAGPIDLNTATAAELDALPGVGPVLAQHIVDWRDQHGRFTSVDQLRQVSGVGAAKFADLKSLVIV